MLKGFLLVSSIVGFINLSAFSAFAGCELAPMNGGRSNCSGARSSSGNMSSGSNAGAAAALSMGSIVLQGIINAQGNANEKAEQERERERRIYQEKVRDAPRRAAAAEAAAVGAAGTNPWATSGGSLKKSDKGGNVAPRDASAKNASTQAAGKPKSDGRAPYADAKCVDMRTPRGVGGADWDLVHASNRCTFPIQVRFCFYNKGDEKKCSNTSSPVGWGVSDTIKPGGKTTVVADVPKMPWIVKTLVCDMTNAKRDVLLCLHPKKGSP